MANPTISRRKCFEVDHFAGYDALLEDALLAINVRQEVVQRRHALREAFFQVRPFAGGNDAWQEVEGKNLFRSAVVGVDGEGHPAVHKGLVRRVLALHQLRHAVELVEPLVEALIMRPRHPRRGKHLVVKPTVLVVGK
jgi:hypothetical protein